MKVNLKRIYDKYERGDGFRILVDGLWPRGIKKEEAHVDLWMKQVAPSTPLRKWFAHDPEKWSQFILKYRDELRGSGSVQELRILARKYKTVTLLYSAADTAHNQAVALKKILTEE